MQSMYEDDVINQIENETLSHKDIFTGEELLKMDVTEQPLLWKPFFRDTGLHIITGMPDSGKSLFSLQFCISVAYGLNEFLGYPLNVKHQRAVFVETEDDRDDVALRYKKQVGGLNLPPTYSKNLRYYSPLITDHASKIKMFDTIREMLIEDPADVVAIASLGDVLLSDDGNSNAKMRETMNHINAIAIEQKTLILVVHHVNKSVYGKSPTQAGIQGAAAIVQKARLACQLSNGDDGQKYLSFVKGNHLAYKYKQDSLILTLNEKDLVFRATGEKIKTENIESKPAHNKRRDIEWHEVFNGRDVLRTGEIQKICREKYKISIATTNRAIKEAMSDGYLVKDEHGFYRLENMD